MNDRYKLSKIRTEYILNKIEIVLGNRVTLITDYHDLHTLIGVKNSSLRDKDTRTSQKTAIDAILTEYLSKKYDISAKDWIRLGRISAPQHTVMFNASESARIRVPFSLALSLFDSDYDYLSGADLTPWLAPMVSEQRSRVLRGIDTDQLHPRWGRGSKVSYRRYRELVAATEPGWTAHLRAIGALQPVAPVNDLAQIEEA